MARFLWICLGGAFGSGMRYLVALWLPTVLGAAFPWATLAVNVVGSFLLAIIMHVGAVAGLMSPTLRLALGTGIMGGFTTYSTFNYETLAFLEAGVWRVAVTYIATTLVGCLAAGFAGTLLARALTGP